ncbi:hypothetical protein ACRAWB_17220 [Leifsonia poae]|uniref:hypothetical protein n=1 Tax=Leifsonia poae TaxID=110933 RepID=UPI003D69CCA4
MRPSAIGASLAAAALALAAALTGCSQAGGCGYDIRVAPLVTVDVKEWVTAHPDTNVRVCVDGDCRAGSGIVAVNAAEPTTPPHDGDRLEITAAPIHGFTAGDPFRTSAPLVHDQCGQEGVWLRMDGTGRLTTIAPDGDR